MGLVLVETGISDSSEGKCRVTFIAKVSLRLVKKRLNDVLPFSVCDKSGDLLCGLNGRYSLDYRSVAVKFMTASVSI